MAEQLNEEQTALKAAEAEAAKVAKASADEATKAAKAAEAEAKKVKTKIVTFVTDALGFCRGDVINLLHESFDKDLIKSIPKSAYVSGEVAQSDLNPIEATEEE